MRNAIKWKTGAECRSSKVTSSIKMFSFSIALSTYKFQHTLINKLSTINPVILFSSFQRRFITSMFAIQNILLEEIHIKMYPIDICILLKHNIRLRIECLKSQPSQIQIAWQFFSHQFFFLAYDNGNLFSI